MGEIPRASEPRVQAGRTNLLFTIADSTPRAKAPAPPGAPRISGMRKLTQTLKNLLRRRGERTMNAKRNSISRFLSLFVVLSVIIPAILSGPVQVALAAQTAWLSPTGNAAASGYTALTNPTYAYGDDTNNATGTNLSSSTTYGQQYLTYTLSIPSGAVLQGIEVRVDYYLSNNNGTNTLSADLSTDGTNWTTADTDTSEPQSQATVILQPTDPLWGRTWTATDLTNLRVRVRMARSSSTTGTFYLDWVSVRLTYNRQPNQPTSLTTDNVTNNPDVTNVNPVFRWTWSDPDGDAQAQSRVEVNTQSNFAGTVMWDSGWVTNNAPNNSTASATYAGTALVFANTTYYWRVTTRDGSGASNNTSPVSAVAQFTTHSNQPPNQPTNVSPAPPPNPLFVNTGNPTFTWSPFSDPNAGDTQSQFYIQVRQNPGSYFYRSTTPSGSANTYNSSWNLADGAYCWNVRVYDNYGAPSALSTETCFTVDTAAPTSSASSPTYANASPFQVTASATEPITASGVASVTLYYRGPTGSWTAFGQINGAGPYSWNFTPSLGNGTYYFQSRACDNAGNCQTAPSGGTGTGNSSTIYDTVAPTSSINPVPAGPINSGAIALPWTASDATSGLIANGVTLWYKFGTGGTWTTDGKLLAIELK